MQIQTYMGAACVFVSMCMILLSSLPCLRRMVSTLMLEACGMLAMLSVMMLLVFGNQPFLVRLMGRQPRVEWGRCATLSDTVPILAIVVSVEIITHVYVARWWTAVPVNIAGAMLYALSIILGSEEESPIFNLIMLMGILWLSAANKRKLEVKERTDYCRLVAEREKRMSAEFRLARLEEKDTPDAIIIGNAAADRPGLG